MIDWEKPIQTKCGRKASLICINEDSQSPYGIMVGKKAIWCQADGLNDYNFEFINVHVLMPADLSEPRAKALLIGEFHEPYVYSCPFCEGEVGHECPACDGEGYITETVPVSWTTVKAIYAMAVKHLQIRS